MTFGLFSPNKTQKLGFKTLSGIGNSTPHRAVTSQYTPECPTPRSVLSATT